MESRQQHPSNSVEAEQVEPIFAIKADHDLIHCPITLQIMRYPVLASDGHHYELAELLRHVRNRMISPLHNDIVLTDATYDTNLKTTLDEANPDSRYPDYDKVAPLRELGQLFATKKLNQVRELEIVQEQRLRYIEEVQHRREQLMLAELRARPRRPIPHDVAQIEFQQMLHDAHVLEMLFVKLWQNLPMARIGRFSLITIATALLVNCFYSASHVGEHNQSDEHMQLDVVNSRGAPIGLLVAAADNAIQHLSQNPNNLFHQMRGAASQYFARWRPEAQFAEDGFDENHVGLHIA